MSAKGYVVRGKRGSDGAEIAAWTHDGGIGSPVSAARFRTPGQACGAADALTYRGCTDVTIFAVAEDGTETPLPSYEEALAKIESLTDESAAGWAIAQARLKIMEEQAAAIARLRAEIARIPGLEQANREAHQAIAGLKAKTARINKAWARLVKAARQNFGRVARWTRRSRGMSAPRGSGRPSRVSAPEGPSHVLVRQHLAPPHRS